MAKGVEKNRLEVLLSALEMKLPMEQIVKLTGYTVDKIKQLAAQWEAGKPITN